MVEEKIEEVKELKLIKKKRVEFQLEEEILNFLDARVKIKGLSRSEYIRNLILKDTQNRNQGIKLFIKGKKRELEALEDELMKLLDEEKEKLEDYKKYLL